MILILTGLLAFLLAASLGANDVANSMGTSVGSKAITLRQALVIAGVLEFTGAVLFGQRVSSTLATQVVSPDLFTAHPQILLIGMVGVLLSSVLWLAGATWRGLPVSSSHAIVGALAGFGWVAVGWSAVHWPTLGLISLSWVVTPLISAVLAAGAYSLVRHWILQRSDRLSQMGEWAPWLSVAPLGVFGLIVLPSITVPIAQGLQTRFHVALPPQDLALLLGGVGAMTLCHLTWRQLDQLQTVAEATCDQTIEPLMARFQLVSACFVAFAHGSNDVGNAIAPLVVIRAIDHTGQVPEAGSLAVPLELLLLGGGGIVLGLALWGRRVIATVGENIIALKPSGGFCAELATATTVLLASRLGLPVSTSHALVGAVIGIGLVQNWRSIQMGIVGSIGLAWVTTVPIAAALSAGLFALGSWIK